MEQTILTTQPQHSLFSRLKILGVGQRLSNQTDIHPSMRIKTYVSDKDSFDRPSPNHTRQRITYLPSRQQRSPTQQTPPINGINVNLTDRNQSRKNSFRRKNHSYFYKITPAKRMKSPDLTSECDFTLKSHIAYGPKSHTPNKGTSTATAYFSVQSEQQKINKSHNTELESLAWLNNQYRTSLLTHKHKHQRQLKTQIDSRKRFYTHNDIVSWETVAEEF